MFPMLHDEPGLWSLTKPVQDAAIRPDFRYLDSRVVESVPSGWHYRTDRHKG